MSLNQPAPPPGPIVPVSPAGPKELNSVVAKASPELYSAAVRTNITREDRNLFENWAYIKTTHEDLMSLTNAEAKIKFNSLNPDLQDALEAYYKVDYANKGEGAAAPVTETMPNQHGHVEMSMAYRSPFRFLLQVASKYGETINTPYRALELAAINGESLSNKKTWDMAANGNYIYDEDTANSLIDKYGGAASFAAIHTLAGMTPGEIIDAWGTTNTEILDAVETLVNDPTKFEEILTEFDHAKLSVGRNAARWLNKRLNIEDEANKELFTFMGKKYTAFDIGSGTLDASFQILADPLTYLTGGLSVLGKSKKLAEALANGRTVAEHLAIPEVAAKWSDYTARIGEYSKALDSGDTIGAAKIQREISTKHSDHGTAQEIYFWHKLGVKDLDSFSSVIDKDAEAFTRIIRGRTSDQMYQREGAAYASRSRALKLAAKTKLRETIVGKDGFESLDKVPAEQLVKELIDGGQDLTGTFKYNTALDVLAKRERNKFQNFMRYMTSLHPGRRMVYVNENVTETIDVFNRQANLLFENQAIADVLSQVFLTSSQMERVAIKKSVDELTLRKMGVHGVDDGENVIRTILSEKYGSTESFAATRDFKTASVIQEAANRIGLKMDDAIDVSGPLHPYQLTEAISALDYRGLSEMVAMQGVSGQKLNVYTAIPKLIGGAFNSKIAGKLTDAWVLLTLAPMLGIRTAIDEGFMFSMVADKGVLLNLREASRAGNILTAYTNDLSASGPLKVLLQRGIRRVTSMHKDVYGGGGFGAYNSITKEMRQTVLQRHKNLMEDGYYSSYKEMAQKAREEIFYMAAARFGRSDEVVEWVKSLAEANPNLLKTTSSASIADSLTMRKDIFQTDPLLVDKTGLDRMLEDQALEASGVFTAKYIEDLAEIDLDKAMYKNLYTRFFAGGFTYNGKELAGTDLGRLFIANHGLRYPEDTLNALDHFMRGLGFSKNESTGKWVLSNQKVPIVKQILQSGRHSAKYLNDGATNLDEAALRFASDSLADLYHVFHGSSTNYNRKLVKVFDDFITGRVGDHRQILRNLQFDDYRKLIVGNKAEGTIFTDLKPIAGDTLEDWWIKFRDKNFEYMSRQTDDIIRQKLVLAHYIGYRKQYQAIEKQYADRMAQSLMEDGYSAEAAIKKAEETTAYQFREITIRQAADRVLKYVDNPEIRTVFSYNMRSVGRFYRAVEDFWRRMYRLTNEHGLGTIYRLRLMNQGLAGVGSVHTDENGDQFVVMPMDDVIFSAVDNSMRLITGNTEGIRQPLFNDLTFKLTAGNPSFQTDAGMPYLSGPAGSISVAAAKWLLGKFDTTANLAEDLDNAALGDLGDNVTFRSAVTPKLVRNFWRIMHPDEKATEEVSALTQAMSYYEANNLTPKQEDYVSQDANGNTVVDELAFNKAKRQYLDNVRITAHNIIVTRSILGMIMPFAVQSKDFKDLPDYLKQKDITSMSGSFYDVLEAVKKNYPDLGDPYEQALATWTADNPGKLPYTVSKNGNEIKVVMDFSKQMQDWAIKNRSDVAKFGEGALIFAPKSGEFNAGVWAWASAAGLTGNIPEGQDVNEYISDYYDRLRLRKYTNAYYKTHDDEAEELANIPINWTNNRRAVTVKYENMRAGMKMAVPGLADYINKGRDNEANIEFINNVYTYVNSSNADVSVSIIAATNQMYEIYSGFNDTVNSINMQNYSNGSELKRQYKQAAIEELQQIIKTDDTGALKSFFDYGLEPLMNSLSRDARSGINRNVIQ